MTYSIKYHPAVTEDLQLLGEAVRRDLTGYQKAYVDNRRVRMVYRISEAEISILVIAVGKREDLEVYKIAYQQLMK